MSDRVRVLLAADHFSPAFRFGGPIQSLAALVACTHHAIDWRVVTRSRDFRSAERLPGIHFGRWAEYPDSARLYLDQAPGPRDWRRLIEEVEPDVVYLNSFLSRPFSMAVQAARVSMRSSPPCLIAPRGELAPGAMRVRSLRKHAFVKLARRLRCYAEAVWHAASHLEADEIRSALHARRVEVIPNIAASLEASPVHDKIPGTLRAVFLGRVAPKKNLLGLIKALCLVRSQVELEIVGVADDAAYLAECEAAAEMLPANVLLAWRGGRSPAEVHNHLRAAHCLLLPTHAENFGHAIAEALALGRPVLVGAHTPWTDAVRSGAGVVVDSDDTEAIRSGVEMLAGLDAPALGAMGRVAVGVAGDAVASSESLGRRYIELFCGLAGGAGHPIGSLK